MRVALCALFLLCSEAAQPNIVLLVLDDLGWADVGYHGSNFPTPTIDQLAAGGVKLNRMYAMPQCSPTRAAVLTGRYSFHTGMQHFTTLIMGSEAGIPKDSPTIAEVMHDAGYETHAIGKWHLGASTWAQTPTGRGFESHVGYFQGQTDYYNHTIPSCASVLCLYPMNKGAEGYQGSAEAAGYDFWKNKEPLHELFGEYTVPTYVSRFEEVVSANAQEPSRRPLFVYFAEQQMHIPLQLPPQPEHAEKCRAVAGGSAVVNRTVLCAMASKLDESVAQIVSILTAHGLWENTLLWAYSDNGGMTHWADVFPASASSNWPLRGGKTTLFEGGVRAVSFVAGGLLPAAARGTELNALLHAVDIFPTISAVANVSLPPSVAFDGRNAWPLISAASTTPLRTELPLNIDTNPLSFLGNIPHLPHKDDGLANYSAIISWPWKLIVGVVANPAMKNGENVTDGWWTIDPYERQPPPPYAHGHASFLFNIDTDEGERSDVAADHPDIVANLTARIAYWADKATGFVRSQVNLPLPLANPRLHNWTWAPFRP